LPEAGAWSTPFRTSGGTHIRTYQGGILEAEAAALFERFDPAALVYVRTGVSGG
jgi:hypothetical protein